MNDQTYIKYPGVTLEPNVTVGDFSVLGKPSRPSRQGDRRTPSSRALGSTTIGRDTHIGCFVLIEEGATIGRQCVIEPGAIIETGAFIADGSFIVHGARLCAHCSVGAACVIGGFVAERTVVGDHSRVFGKLIHRQVDPTLRWDDVSEPAPILDAKVFIGMGAIIIGPVKIGAHVYVTAGAIVTKDVPPNSIVHGINRVVSPKDWRGELPRSPFWELGR